MEEELWKTNRLFTTVEVKKTVFHYNPILWIICFLATNARKPLESSTNLILLLILAIVTGECSCAGSGLQQMRTLGPKEPAADNRCMREIAAITLKCQPWIPPWFRCVQLGKLRRNQVGQGVLLKAVESLQFVVIHRQQPSMPWNSRMMLCVWTMTGEKQLRKLLILNAIRNVKLEMS